jgi:hypothetical protein
LVAHFLHSGHYVPHYDDLSFKLEDKAAYGRLGKGDMNAFKQLFPYCFLIKNVDNKVLYSVQ